MYNNNDFYNNYGFTNNDFSAVRSEPLTQSASAPAAKKEKKKHRGMKTAALVLACSLLSGVTGAAAVSAVNSTNPNSTTLTQSSRSTAAVEMEIIQRMDHLVPGKVLCICSGTETGSAEIDGIRSREYSSLHMFKRTCRS